MRLTEERVGVHAEYMITKVDFSETCRDLC